MANYISDLRSLRNEVDSLLGSSATEEDVERVASILQADPKHPAWGDDWSDYFDNQDLWAFAIEGGTDR